MKKYISFGTLLCVIPSLCLGYSARYTRLLQEKQRKIEELEKCTGSTGKLKIAGISTLGLTAAGVAGNVVEAKKIKEYGKESEKLDKKLETARKEKEAEEKKVEREKESKECMALSDFKDKKLIKSMKKNDDKCVIDACVNNAREKEDGTDCECKDHYKESGKRCVKEGGPQKSNTPAETGLKGKEAKDGNSYYANGGDWFVEFDYGTVSGGALCSDSQVSPDFEQNIPSPSSGSNCWCKVTVFTPTDTGEEHSGEKLLWVGLKKIESSCESSCGNECAKGVKTNSSLRKALYTSK